MPMGSTEETPAPAKPPNSKPFSAATTPPVAPEVLTSTSYSAEWPASVQAFYSGGATVPPAFFPPVWAGQHLMSPYSTPIAYSPMYVPGAVYAHPSLTPVGMSYPSAELGTVKSRGASLKFGEGEKAASGSGEDDSSQSEGSPTDGSSDTGNESTDVQENSKKRSRGDALREGEASHIGIATLRNRARKLPVSAPGRTTLSGPATNLNIGMGIWNPPHAGASPVKDDRELKRERRKQSNRESARRSRLRKQQECDELAKKVADLKGENNALRMDLEELHKVCKDLEAENQQISEELSCLRGDSTYSLKQKVSSEPTSR